MTPREICAKIGEALLIEAGGDYEKAKDEADKLAIRSVEHDPKNGRVVIKTTRPGYLIGKKGERVGTLSQAIGCKIHIVEEMNDPTEMIVGWLSSNNPAENDYSAKDEYDSLADYWAATTYNPYPEDEV